MAEPFLEPLPTPGGKPWTLNNVITEIRERAAELEDAVNAVSNEYALSTSPEKYNAVGDGIADDSDAVEAAFAERSAFGKVAVKLLGKYKVTRELAFDAAQQMMVGQGGAIIDGINDSSKWLLTVYSTDPGDIASPIRQAALGVSNVIFWGGGRTNGINITGASFSDKPAHVSFTNVVVTGFGTAVRFGRNAYMDRFHKSNISLSRVGILYDGAANAGERLSFVDCDVTGHGTAIVSTGQAMNFVDCSFSYNLGRIARLSGGAQIYINSGSHIEMNSPYKPWFVLSGNGTTVNITDTRWLLRDQSMTTTATTFTSGNATVTWADNPRDRYEVGDPFRFGGVFGPTNIDGATTYYFTQVSSTGFQFSTTAGGSAITPNASGTAAGLLPFQGAPIIQSASTNMFTIRGGHISGSSSTTRTQTIFGGTGGGFVIRDTSGYDQSTLRFRSRANGDLFDGTFTSVSIQDDWEWDSAIGTLEIDTSINAIRFTKTAGGAGEVRLWVPVSDAASFLMEFRHRSSAAVAVSHQAFWRPRRTLSGRSELYSSTLNAGAATDGDYTQAGFVARHAPAGTRYLLFTWTMTNLAVGDTFRLQNVFPSLS